MKVSLEKTRRFHRIKEQIPAIVRGFIKKEHIVYGGRAINNQVLAHLRTPSKDFDIFSKTPKQDAKELEAYLDKKAGADIFTSEPAKHKGTFKVKDLRGETIADFTKMPNKIKFKQLAGIKVETIGSMTPKIKKTIRNPTNAHRKLKDIDNLNRIKLMRKFKL